MANGDAEACMSLLVPQVCNKNSFLLNYGVDFAAVTVFAVNLLP